MKRFFPILLALLALTGCPQAGQILGPGVTSATAPREGGGDSTSSTTPPDVTSPPPATDTTAASNPIEPKSDPHSIQDGEELASLVRLRYGENFETILSTETTTPDKITLATDGTIDLPATAEMRESADAPWHDSTGLAVRMVYRPRDTSAQVQYCDANVLVDYSAEEGGNVLFSGVTADVGSLEFYHLIPTDADQHKGFAALAHDSVTPCSSGWQTLDSEASLKTEWIYLGSMDSVAHFRTVSYPQPVSNPQTQPAVHPLLPVHVITKP